MANAGESPVLATDFVIGARGVAMRPVLELAQRAARAAAHVLITGESGTGKRSLARWIHGAGARRGGPLVSLGGATMSDALVVAARDRGRHGVFGEAAGGTLVLDELCELSPEAQAALVLLLDVPGLRASGIQGTRVIATSRAPRGIESARRRGELRADLYYALAVIAIPVPPLRDRTEDLPALVAAFLARARPAAVEITAAALAWLAGAEWPGNVRELEAAIERAVALCDDGVIDVEDVAGLAVVTSPAHRRRRSSPR